MATINASNLELTLLQKLNSTESSFEVLTYSKALEQIRAGAVYTVYSFTDLPLSATAMGEVYFVEADRAFYSATTEYGWLPLTQSLANTLWTWGYNQGGRLGDGTTADKSSPGTTAGGGTTWAGVSSGVAHTSAVKTDGTLWTWGDNICGRLGDGTTTQRTSPGTTSGGGTTWASVSSGSSHTSAIKTDGTLWTWGFNETGRLGDDTLVDRSSPGTTAGSGTDWASVSSGPGNTSAVKTDGTLWTWGYNLNGQLGDGTVTNRSSPGITAGGGTDWVQVSSGSTHTSAVKTDGTLWTWGGNGSGRLGDGTVTSRTSPGTTAGGGTNWATVSSGDSHTSAVKTDGTLWTWGSNGSAQLGDGTTTQRTSPGTTAGGGTDWASVSSGNDHTSAVKTDGTLWTWGDNSSGQLGAGTTTSRSSPGTTSGGGTNWASVSSGSCYTAAIQIKSF